MDHDGNDIAAKSNNALVLTSTSNELANNQTGDGARLLGKRLNA